MASEGFPPADIIRTDSCGGCGNPMVSLHKPLQGSGRQLLPGHLCCPQDSLACSDHKLRPPALQNIPGDGHCCGISAWCKRQGLASCLGPLHHMARRCCAGQAHLHILLYPSPALVRSLNPKSTSSLEC